jgi:hypothetical protein
MERGNTKHGPAHDEQMAHETEGMVRGSAQRPHGEEWRETEPVENAVPPPRRAPGGNPRPDLAERIATLLRTTATPAGTTFLSRWASAPRNPAGDQFAAEGNPRTGLTASVQPLYRLITSGTAGSCP